MSSQIHITAYPFAGVFPVVVNLDRATRSDHCHQPPMQQQICIIKLINHVALLLADALLPLKIGRDRPMEKPVIPMSWEEYELLERPFGWKVEYWDDHARLTPRSIGVRTKIDLSPRDSSHNHRLIPVQSDYYEQMLSGYLDAFGDSVEFCGWPIESIQESAAKDVGNYFAERRGKALSASVIALAPDSEQLAGLALFIDRPEIGPYMDLLYVRPAFQRQGIGKAMLAWGIDRLIESGFQALSSSYHICNELSRVWHHQQGFQDVYDSYYSQMKMRWCEHEIWRREQLGMHEGLAALRQERDDWASRIDPDEWRLSSF